MCARWFGLRGKAVDPLVTGMGTDDRNEYKLQRNTVARQTMSASWALKALALAMIYVFFGHPNIYSELWHRRAWLPLIAASVAVPMGTYECLRILVVRLKLESVGFSLRSLSGTVFKKFSQVASVERRHGQFTVHFRDGGLMTIPWLVGNLDSVHTALNSHTQRP